jgi:hypothetical protein
MVLKREASCPLCGAKLAPTQVLDACEEVVDAALGVLGCRCPYCQGYFEVKPTAESVEIGYLQNGCFETVVSLPVDGLTMLRDTATGLLRIRLGGRDWKFEE